jgi:hypothetical protein
MTSPEAPAKAAGALASGAAGRLFSPLFFEHAGTGW